MLDECNVGLDNDKQSVKRISNLYFAHFNPALVAGSFEELVVRFSYGAVRTTLNSFQAFATSDIIFGDGFEGNP